VALTNDSSVGSLPVDDLTRANLLDCELTAVYELGRPAE
jgi:hypothetical protein